ncbi:hypothetical protein OE88DRAFT_1641221 [Heliocybe sulcata]|uniref:Uncharacterized protein n=1 Tax=Heliocybe sulcata TaxID=5364 RepID=A0A5C3NN61_9AGAM|nr:hypothetical protein OE88DRAFT_1641221 [Heliocybe sulcata]
MPLVATSLLNLASTTTLALTDAQEYIYPKAVAAAHGKRADRVHPRDPGTAALEFPPWSRSNKREFGPSQMSLAMPTQTFSMSSFAGPTAQLQTARGLGRLRGEAGSIIYV